MADLAAKTGGETPLTDLHTGYDLLEVSERNALNGENQGF
jgi:hypothetical protein